MPNYVNNTIKLIGSEKDVEKVLELLKNKNPEDNEAIDFNNVIPMPKSLQLVSGGHDTCYVAAYVNTLSDTEKGYLMKRLAEIPTSYYKNYFRKYADSFTGEVSKVSLKYMKNNFKEDYKSINPSSIEEVGKAYIDNILNYGADTWYDWCCNNWGTKWGAMDSFVEGNVIGFNTAWSASIPITNRLSQMFSKVIFAHEWADEDIGSNCGRCVMQAGEVLDEYLPEGEEAVAFACNMWGYEPEDYDASKQAFVSLDDVISSCEKVSSKISEQSNKKETLIER